MKEKIKTSIHSVILSGIFVFIIGLYFIVIKAGLPYQDPTTEMAIKWMAYNTAGEICMKNGIIIFALGLAGQLTHKLIKRK